MLTPTRSAVIALGGCLFALRLVIALHEGFGFGGCRNGLDVCRFEDGLGFHGVQGFINKEKPEDTRHPRLDLQPQRKTDSQGKPFSAEEKHRLSCPPPKMIWP